jgi:hypothetical protein
MMEGMQLPPSVPAPLRRKPWLAETYREDRILVSDPSLFDVEPYREGSVEWLSAHMHEWNRGDARHLPLLHEYNWVESTPGGFEWRRCYGVPTDGTHRAAAAKATGIAAWIEILAYYFEQESVYLHGLPIDRQEFAPWLVPVGAPPRPRHEVLTLPVYTPRDLLKTTTPAEDGLLGFGDQGGVARVRLYEMLERTVILFSPEPRAEWGPSPYGSVHGQVAVMQSIWDHLLIGKARHPLDVEWWAHPGGRRRTWYDATAGVRVMLSEAGWYEFRGAPREDAEAVMASPRQVAPRVVQVVSSPAQRTPRRQPR